MFGAIQFNKAVLLNSQGFLLRTLGTKPANTCVVQNNKVIVSFTDGSVQLFDTNGLSLRQYTLPSNVKSIAASFSGNNQIIINASNGKSYTFTLDGQP